MANSASREYAKAYRAKRRAHYNELNRVWIQKNRDRYNQAKYRYRDALKIKVIGHYSSGTGKCAHCGFDNIDALCLDHINDDGAAERKRMKISGRTYNGGARSYEKLHALGFPPGYQVLCANCNMIKEIKRKRRNRGKEVKDAKPTNTTADYGALQLFA